MKHTNLAGLALLKLQTTLRKPNGAVPVSDELSDPRFLEQEPDLAKEAGEHTRQTSAWAAGGHPSD